MGIKEFIFGEGEGYEYGALCMPTLPWKKSRKPMKFYPLDEPLPLMLSLVMGLQHAFAMVGGLITPPFVIAKFSIDSFPFEMVALQQYFIVAALITSGICTIINVMKVEIPFSKKFFGKRLYVGSGLLSVMVSYIYHMLSACSLYSVALLLVVSGRNISHIPTRII